VKKKMVQVWNSYQQVEEAVDTIDKIMKQTGKLPDVYTEAVRETLRVSSKGLVQRFYTLLAEKRPSTLQYFTEVSATKKPAAKT